MYCYYINRATLKIFFSNNILYLPYTIDSDLKLEKLINDKIVIYFTNPVRIYGYATIIKHITYSDTSNSYNKLINLYNMAPMEHIEFFKIDKLHIITPIIQLSDLNNFLTRCNKIKQNIKLPSNKTLYTIHINDKSLIEFIDSYELHLQHSDTESETETDSSSDSNSETESESESEPEELKQYCIPILWVCCDKLNKLINNGKIKKNELKYHFLQCDDCEINNNNDDFKNIDFDNCKLGRYDKKNIKEIINSYSRGINLELCVSTSKKLDLEENKISLFYNEKENDVYDKCIFIVK